MADRHVIVVGGGIVGLATARSLVRRGCRVTLLEAGRIEDSASTGNAGILVPGHLPLPKPGLVRKALRWLLDPAAPLYIPPRVDLELWLWLLRFGRACRPSRVAHCMEVFATLGAASDDAWRLLLEEESLDCSYRPLGSYNIYCTEAGRRGAEADAEAISDWGFDVAPLGGEALRALEPAFSEAVLGGLHLKDGGCLDPGACVTGLAASLLELGVDLRERTPVARLRLDGGRCRGVELADGTPIDATDTVLAAGCWTAALAAGAGLRIPLQPGKGYHIDLEEAEGLPAVPCVLVEALIAATPMKGFLRLAGTIEFSGLNHRLVGKRLAMLTAGSAACFRRDPGECRELARWCGLRPCIADGLPVVGPVVHLEGLHVATGLEKMGMTHGPLTGRLLAELILDGRASLDISALTPSRFGRR